MYLFYQLKGSYQLKVTLERHWFCLSKVSRDSCNVIKLERNVLKKQGSCQVHILKLFLVWISSFSTECFYQHEQSHSIIYSVRHIYWLCSFISIGVASYSQYPRRTPLFLFSVSKNTFDHHCDNMLKRHLIREKTCFFFILGNSRKTVSQNVWFAITLWNTLRCDTEAELLCLFTDSINKCGYLWSAKNIFRWYALLLTAGKTLLLVYIS